MTDTPPKTPRAKRATQTGTKQMTIRIPDDLFARLDAAADARGVSREWFTARLLGEAIETVRAPEDFTLTGTGQPATQPEPIGPIGDPT